MRETVMGQQLAQFLDCYMMMMMMKGEMRSGRRGSMGD
jgi:hypothetical protein